MSDEINNIFIDEASNWICGSYSLIVGFYAIKENNEYVIQVCKVDLYPLPSGRDNSFLIERDVFALGQVEKNNISKEELISFIHECVNGKLNLHGIDFNLVANSRLNYYSEMLHIDKWFHSLHLKVSGDNMKNHTNNQVRIINNDLRSSEPVFDGLDDATRWLGLGDKGTLNSNATEINISIGPPVDIIIGECLLKNDTLNIVLEAHKDFDINSIQLSICPAPRVDIHSSRQIASEIEWSLPDERSKKGIALINLQEADSVLLMLLINGNTVRRQWILDADKTRNNRQLSIQHFDKELKMTKKAVFDLPDSNKFEEGTALLLFMMGFNSAIQIETDSPDIIMYSPGGKLVLVECTTRIADFANKVGKLVDRRGGLEKSLKENSHHSLVYGALVCRLPRDQIDTLRIDLRKNKIILICKEELEQAFISVRNGVNPEKYIDNAIDSMSND